MTRAPYPTGMDPRAQWDGFRRKATIALWKSSVFGPCTLERQMTKGIPSDENSRVIKRGKQ